MELKTLEKLLALAKKHKLSELEVENGKVKYRFKTALAAPQFVASPGVFGQAANPHVGGEVEPPPPLSEERHSKVLSPFVGTFYRAPSPEADPYVKEGQVVKKGDVLCIVEAMKLMNEIESEVSGKVVTVLAENGQPVEYGEPLFLIDPV